MVCAGLELVTGMVQVQRPYVPDNFSKVKGVHAKTGELNRRQSVCVNRHIAMICIYVSQ